MQTININLLDLRTLDKALKQIEQYQKRLRELIPDFLKACAETVRDMANNIVDTLGYDEIIKSGIKNGWLPIEKGETVVLENAYDKAVYIEFGTGLMGSAHAHDEARESGYEYDVKKHGMKGWNFVYDANEGLDVLNVDENNFTRLTKGKKAGMVIVHTVGAPASMFLYQAATEFAERKVYERVWKEFASKRKL